jgi:DNA-binding XRE family transcriptional regulator
MNSKGIQKKVPWTPEDRARHRAIRDQFKNHPTPEELVASGEYEPAGQMGDLLTVLQILAALKKARAEAGLSLADVAERSGIDKAALSRLENGHHEHPTLATLGRYATAVGKQLVVQLADLPAPR